MSRCIAILGSYPPPYGGVSIHIQRLKHELDKMGIDCNIYDFSDKKTDERTIIKSIKNPITWLLRYIYKSDEQIIHIHNSDWRLCAAIGLMSLLGKKTVITIHGNRLNTYLSKSNVVKKYIIKITLRRYSFVIAVNNDIERLCCSIGIPSKRIEVIPAFLPPIVNYKDIDEIPNKTWDFINSHRPVISANAFRIAFHDNQDLYGIDMCIRLCSVLKNNYPKIGFIFCLPEIGDCNYFNKLLDEIKNKNLERNFMFLTEAHQFYPIIMKSDIFIRPTNTDGDAISLREALYFKIPAIASDAVERPKGTLLFKNRDFNDLTCKVIYLLNNYEIIKQEMKTLELLSNLERIITIYNKLYK